MMRLSQAEFEAAIKGKRITSVIFDENFDTYWGSVNIILENGARIEVSLFIDEPRGIAFDFGARLATAPDQKYPNVLS